MSTTAIYSDFHRTLSWRGGARLGRANATWPFVSVLATRDSIKLAIPAFRRFMQAEYEFPAAAVRSIEPYVFIPLVAWGVRIQHTIPEYPERIVLWTLQHPSKLLGFIANVGFRPAT